MTVATVTVKASQNTLVILTNHIIDPETQYLLLAGSSKEFTIRDTEFIQVEKTDLHLVKPEHAHATVTPF